MSIYGYFIDLPENTRTNDPSRSPSGPAISATMATCWRSHRGGHRPAARRRRRQHAAADAADGFDAIAASRNRRSGLPDPAASARPADSLALLLLARTNENLSPTDLQQLGRISAGGGELTNTLQIQAAWLYLKHTRRPPDRHGPSRARRVSRVSTNQVIPLSRPDISDDDIQAVTDVLRGGRLSLGPSMETFEEQMAARVGRSEGVAVSSGTAGLHLLLEALDVGPGDEVITPPSAASLPPTCIEHAEAKPVFVDCDPTTLNVRAEDVEAKINAPRPSSASRCSATPPACEELAASSAKYEIPLDRGCLRGARRPDRPRCHRHLRPGRRLRLLPEQADHDRRGRHDRHGRHPLADACRSMREPRTPSPTGCDGRRARGSTPNAWGGTTG